MFYIVENKFKVEEKVVRKLCKIVSVKMMKVCLFLEIVNKKILNKECFLMVFDRIVVLEYFMLCIFV